MDAQAKQNVSANNASPASKIVVSDNFDLWAKAVRQQMLDCLQKRSGRSQRPS